MGCYCKKRYNQILRTLYYVILRIARNLLERRGKKSKMAVFQNGRETVRRKLKNRQKCIFCVFRLFLSLHRTASRPYRLSHIRVVQKPTFLSNSKIDGRHKIFSLSMSKTLEKNVFFENLCMFKIGSKALKFQKISRTRNVDF